MTVDHQQKTGSPITPQECCYRCTDSQHNATVTLAFCSHAEQSLQPLCSNYLSECYSVTVTFHPGRPRCCVPQTIYRQPTDLPPGAKKSNKGGSAVSPRAIWRILTGTHNSWLCPFPGSPDFSLLSVLCPRAERFRGGDENGLLISSYALLFSSTCVVFLKQRNAFDDDFQA